MVSYINQQGNNMKTILNLIAVTITGSLLFVAVTNITAAPVWMSLMILISSSALLVMAIDLAESLKKVKAFTMIELIAVITIMAVLLTLITSIRTPDHSQKDVKVIGGMIQLYNAKAFSLQDGEFYSIHIGETLTVTDHTGKILESKELTAPIEFFDNSDSSRTFIFNRRGEVQDLAKVLRFKVGEYKVKLNNFTGKFSYYDELAEY